mgnify:CR=1 FL=1
MHKSVSGVLIMVATLCFAVPSASVAQQARKTDQEVYQDRIRSCEWGHRSRASSRNYKNGTTRAEVDAKLKKCLDIERQRYERIVQMRARQNSARQ